MNNASPRLLAIVEVDKTARVYCAQPGCKHTVYKAIHVVREGENPHLARWNKAMTGQRSV